MKLSRGARVQTLLDTPISVAIPSNSLTTNSRLPQSLIFLDNDVIRIEALTYKFSYFSQLKNIIIFFLAPTLVLTNITL